MKYDFNGLNVKRDYNNWLNDATYFDYYTRLKNIAINSFEWINLPDTCDERFLELILFEFGYCLFFQHDLNGAFLTLQCAIQGPLNMYRIPIERRAYAITGFQQFCNDQNSVIIWNNYLRQPTALTVELYAERLTNIERTINVNLNALKTPVLITGTQAQQKSLQAVYKKYDGNSPVIFGDKSLMPDALKVLDTNAPEVYINLQRQKNAIWNEAMTFLGANNTNMDKRERQTDDEVNANNEQLMIQRAIQLNSRKEACKWINQMWADSLPYGPIDVRYRQLGGEVGGEIYDGGSYSMRNSSGIEQSRDLPAD